MITRQDIAAHLERQVRVGFLAGRKMYSPLRDAFVREVPSDGAFETYADMGTLPWPTQNAGKMGAGGTDARTQAPKVNRISGGRQITLIGGQERSLIVYNVDWEITIGIEHNAIDDDQAGDLETWARNAAVNFEKHKDYLSFDALKNGSSTAYYGTGYDKLAFFSASHIDPGAEYQTVQDNTGALALSLDNFKTQRIAASKFLDDRGKPLGYNHNLLIVPPDLEFEAAQITQNKEAYDTANRAMNPYAGNIRSLVAPGGWLSSTNWFLIDSSQLMKPLNLQVRKQPELWIWDDQSTEGGGVRYYKWHARYSLFYGDWRLCIQGNA
jgi:phage major head subunit gpT-like protein